MLNRTGALLRWMGRVHRWAHWWMWAVLAFFAYDIMRDLLHDGVDVELVLEAVTFAAVLIMLYVEWRRGERLAVDLGVARADQARTQAGLQRLAGQFSDFVRDAFESWQLSRSEQAVAWLILKGFPFAEIAALRGVQEKTVRQQATAIYAKSGCKNRNELVSHFIEDLLAGELGGLSGLVAPPDTGEAPPEEVSPLSPAAPETFPTSGRARE